MVLFNQNFEKRIKNNDPHKRRRRRGPPAVVHHRIAHIGPATRKKRQPPLVPRHHFDGSIATTHIEAIGCTRTPEW
ncbi:hypothetical protein BC828DRAFT_271524 [Blastocladiella britannica]|nr:hypothetical protein BC828DRAFT_271524 [Blastocladiella britannica]